MGGCKKIISDIKERRPEKNIILEKSRQGQVSFHMLLEHGKTDRDWNISNLMEQSADLKMDETVPQMDVANFTTTERDMHVSDVTSRDETFEILHTADTSLSDFLARPIFIEGQLLSLNAGLNISRNYFRSFVNHPRVANRINNYAYISGRLHLKVLVNGTPFHYGLIVLSYEPLPAYTTNTVIEPTTEQKLQLPHVIADMSSSEGATLSFELMHPLGAIDLTNLDAGANQPCRCSLFTLAPLRGVGDIVNPVRIDIYAWMTEVRLSLPTRLNITGLVAQSETQIVNKDRPGTLPKFGALAGNIISTIIPYARASMDAIGMGLEMAAAFGFSRPSVVPEYRHIANKPYSNISNMNVTDTSVKLALDAKNEVTVDPRVAGFSPKDEMNVVSLGKREFLFTSFDWETTDAVRTTKQYWGVTPCVAARIGTTPSYVLSPAFHTAAPFRYWRGTVYYRIEIIASAFHRGLLRVIYDPIGTLRTTDVVVGSANDNVLYNHNVDISSTKNYEFCVGMGTNRNFLRVVSLDGTTYGGGTVDLSGTNSRSAYSGFVGIQIGMPLTTNNISGGTSVGSVRVNVYMRMGDDFEVADANQANIQEWTPRYRATVQTLSRISEPLDSGGAIISGDDELILDDFEEQSGVPGNVTADGGLVSMTPSSLCLNNVDPYIDQGKLSATHFGEKITSIRQIIKRYTLFGTSDMTTTAGSNYVVCALIVPSVPCYRGISETATPVFGVTANNVRTGALQWYTPCFVGFRGSYRWKIANIPTDLSTVSYLNDSIGRAPRLVARGFKEVVIPQSTTGLARYTSNFLTTDSARIESGGSINQSNVNYVHEIEMPYHYVERFKPFTLSPETNATLYDENPSNVEPFASIVLVGVSSTYVVRRMLYVAAGDDYSLLYFKYTPIVSKYTIVDTV